MKELKVGDEVEDGVGTKGKVIGILSETPKGYVGPVVIATNDPARYSSVIYRDIYGGGFSHLTVKHTNFTKVVKKEKLKVFLNIYPSGNTPFVMSHNTAEIAEQQASPSAVGVAVPYEYEFEVED